MSVDPQNIRHICFQLKGYLTLLGYVLGQACRHLKLGQILGNLLFKIG